MKLYEHQLQGLEAVKDLNHVAIKGYEGLYEVDQDGNVFSIRNQKILKQYSNGTGYLKVNLYDRSGKCKKKYIHRLVAEAFVPNPLNLKEVNHKDLNKKNCNASNLEWCDRKQNLQHSYDNGMKRTCETHGCSKLNWKAVDDIRSKALSQKAYAQKYNISVCTVSAVQCNRTWKVGDVKCHV